MLLLFPSALRYYHSQVLSGQSTLHPQASQYPRFDQQRYFYVKILQPFMKHKHIYYTDMYNMEQTTFCQPSLTLFIYFLAFNLTTA